MPYILTPQASAQTNKPMGTVVRTENLLALTWLYRGNFIFTIRWQFKFYNVNTEEEFNSGDIEQPLLGPILIRDGQATQLWIKSSSKNRNW